MQMKEKKKLKLWHGILAIIVSAVILFWISPYITAYIGLYSTPVYEGLMVLACVGIVLIFQGDLKKVFPFQRPKPSRIFGTLFFWAGCYGVTMIISVFMLVLFPEEMTSTSQGLSSYFSSVSFFASMLLVSITPAICEELIFRGVILNSFHGSMNKWAVIIVTSVVFGAFHGSIWRFFPTTILGIAMSYILYETGNMFYNMLFHAVNNAIPIIMIFALEALYSAVNLDELVNEAGTVSTETISYPIGTVGIYLIFGGVAAFLLYIGNHLLHLGGPGYQNGLFPKEKRKILFLLIGITVACVVIGIGLFVYTVFSQQDLIQKILDSAMWIRSIS